MNTGEVIKFLRNRDNLTQQELAERLGVQKSSIQKYENGKVQNLKLETIQELCKIFRVAPFAFVFPGVWERIHMAHGSGQEFYKYIAIYSKLTEEGKQKIHDYIEDIGELKRYHREDGEDFIEMHRMFMRMGRNKE